jgi:hypothetical protein
MAPSKSRAKDAPFRPESPRFFRAGGGVDPWTILAAKGAKAAEAAKVWGGFVAYHRWRRPSHIDGTILARGQQIGTPTDSTCRSTPKIIGGLGELCGLGGENRQPPSHLLKS